MAVLTPEQFARLMAIIRDASTAVAVSTSGYEITAEDRKRLEREGFLIPGTEGSLVYDSFVFGQTMQQVAAAKGWTYQELQDHLNKHPVNLSPNEKVAVEVAQQRAGTYCVGLGNRFNAELGQVVVDADAELAQQTRQHIRDKTADKLAQRQTVGKLKTELGRVTGDWARDWDRIAQTESHMAHQEGILTTTIGQYGEDELLAKQPEPDACEHCLKHYLEDGKPKVRKASWWQEQGVSNAGRKAKDWKPVLGAMHPWCRCQLIRVPGGWGFDMDGDLIPLEEAEKSSFATNANLEKAAHKLQGRLDFQGFQISVENRKGSVRHWYDKATDTKGTTKMLWPYGYIRLTEGTDGDHVDVFVGPDASAKRVYVVHQMKAPDFKTFDEDKVMLGFSGAKAAKRAYLRHFDQAGFFGSMTVMPIEEFREKVHARKGQMVKSAQQLGFNFGRSVGGPYIGPRGGKWADAAHTIPWKEATARPLKDGYTGDLIKPGMSVAQTEDAIRKASVEHLGIFLDGKLTQRIKGEATYVDVDPKVMQRVLAHGNATVTHNHPSGTTFSAEDIVMTILNNVAEFRATTPDGGAWVLRRKGSEWGQEFGEVPGEPTSLVDAIRTTSNLAARAACGRMDKHLINAGARAGDAQHPAFSQELFNEFVSEARLQAFNRFLAPTGAKIEKVQPTQARQAAAARSQPGRAVHKRDQADLTKAQDIAVKSMAIQLEDEIDGQKQTIEAIGQYDAMVKATQLGLDFTAPTASPKAQGGPFIGPRGGKWADAKHTIPWKEAKSPKRKRGVEIPPPGVTTPAYLKALEDSLTKILSRPATTHEQWHDTLIEARVYAQRMRADLLYTRGMWSNKGKSKHQTFPQHKAMARVQERLIDLDEVLSEAISYAGHQAKYAAEAKAGELNAYEQRSYAEFLPKHGGHAPWVKAVVSELQEETTKKLTKPLKSLMRSARVLAKESTTNAPLQPFLRQFKIGNATVAFNDQPKQLAPMPRLPVQMSSAERKNLQTPFSVKEIVRGATQAKRALEAAGMGHLWHGVIEVGGRAAKGRVYDNALGEHKAIDAAGFYNVGPDKVKLHAAWHPSIVAEIVVHEIGHRYWFKNLTSEDRARFTSQFGKVEATSKYGSTNEREDFAEAFAAFVIGGAKDMTRDQVDRFKTYLGKSELTGVDLWKSCVEQAGLEPDKFHLIVKYAGQGHEQARAALDHVQELVKGFGSQTFGSQGYNSPADAEQPKPGTGFPIQVGSTHEVNTMGNYGNPARTAGANVRSHKVGEPRDDWPPIKEKKRRVKRKLQRPQERYDVAGLRQGDGWAHPVKLDGVTITTERAKQPPHTEARENLERQQRGRAALRQGSKISDLEINR